MMDATNIQYYKDQLIEYLKSTKLYRYADDAMIQKMVDAIEVDLLKVIQTSLHVDLQTVYKFLAKEDLKSLINETNRGKSLAAQNEQKDGLLRDAMSFYLGYLGSNKHPLSEQEKKKRKKNLSKDLTLNNQVPNMNGEETTTTQNPETLKPKTQIPEPKEYDKLEGAKHQETVTRYERDRGNRKDCIAHYGYVCQVCGLNFEEAYGELGKEFIEVHHLHPVSQGECKVNPIEDLVPLCSNCHSMIHRMDDVSDWKGLKEIYLANKSRQTDDADKSDR